MGSTEAAVWTGTEAAELLRDPAVLDLLLDVPALVLDLRDDRSTPAPLGRVPCPVLGLVRSDATTQWAVDLEIAEGAADTQLLGDDADQAADVLVAAACRAPGAAALFVQVLRATATLPVELALTIESAAYSLLLTGPEFRGWLGERHLPRPAQEGETGVRVRREGARLELTLDRPSVHNAYDASMRDGLVEGLTLALLDPSVEQVVLRGSGPSFCSGGDLRDFGLASDLVRAHAVRVVRHPGALLHALAERTQVVVHGACVGAGVELPAFAGSVLAREDATFCLPELAMGTIPGAGGTVSLPRRIGAGRTLLLALSGISLPVEDALRWGLVDRRESDVSV